MRTVLVIFMLLLVAAGAAAHHGLFYVTGSQFYEGCWQRRAKEKVAGALAAVQADTPSQAALWARCTPIVAESLDKAGFALGSSQGDAPADVKALAGPCPDRFTEIPILLDRLYGGCCGRDREGWRASVD
jgi:hypothetical protein